MGNNRLNPDQQTVSAWAGSRARRFFDISLVLASIPILLPLLICIGLAVFISSGAPILFRQTRVGRSGCLFTIYKFRTMQHSGQTPATMLANSDHVTPFGRLLRRMKLDELPQVFNVLIGDMSLVGPRPKIAAQQLSPFSCRPGLTGPATLAFAREEVFLSRIAADLLPDYYMTTVLPAKLKLDAEYMRHASPSSDLRILFNTLLGNWGTDTFPVHGQDGSAPSIKLIPIDESESSPV